MSQEDQVEQLPEMEVVPSRKEELIESQIVQAAVAGFFQSYRDFKEHAEKASKKDLIRAVGYAFNDGMTDIKVNLINNSDKLLARNIKDLFENGMIMRAAILQAKDNEQVNKPADDAKGVSNGTTEEK